MALQKTLVLLKPDTVWMGAQEQIKDRYRNAGLRIVHARRVRLLPREAEELYREHHEKPVFAGLILAMTSGPIEVLEIEGEDCIARVRQLHGPADPHPRSPGQIRYDFPSAGGPFNMVHASDSLASAKRELALSKNWRSA